MKNYLRYLIVFILFGSLFFTYTITIEPSTIKAVVDKKLPLKIEKKGLLITVNQIDIVKVLNNVVESKMDVDVKIDNSTKVGKFLPKKSLHLTLLIESIPKVHGTFLQFEVFSFKVNKIIKIKEVKGALKKKLESIKFSIKSLEKISWIFSAKAIKFQDNGELLLRVGLSKLIIFLLIPLFLLREIGLLLIVLYQKFLSPRKKYRCAKGQFYQNSTCSSSTKEALKKDGFIAGIKEYRRSTKECKIAYQTLSKDKRRDGTSCDCSYCSGCNVGSCDGAGSFGSACDCSGAVPCEVGSC